MLLCFAHFVSPALPSRGESTAPFGRFDREEAGKALFGKLRDAAKARGVGLRFMVPHALTYLRHPRGAAQRDRERKKHPILQDF